MICSADHLSLSTKDLPCTVSLQFLIRDNKLHLIVNMRSNDLFMGFCYDVIIFTLWQEKMLVELKEFFPELKNGHYYHNANSMHIYSNNYRKIKKILNDKDNNFDSELYNIPRIENVKEFDKLQLLEGKIRNNLSINDEDLSFDTDFANWIKKILLIKNI